jgi:hypothetical protein
MSRGLGRVQRSIIEVFEKEPGRRFTIAELSALAYPGETIERKHREAVRRALKRLEPELGLHKFRVGFLRVSGWRHVIGLRNF